MSQKNLTISIPKSINDETGSITWLKKITVYMVSTVLYLRKFFDEDSFCIMAYETIKLRILKKNCQNSNVKHIIEYLQASLQALNSNFLKAIILGIFEMNEDNSLNKNAVEVYKFDYTNLIKMNEKSETHSTENFQKQTSQILKNLMESLHSMKQLSGGPYYLQFKLEYNDEIVPKDFKVTGFVPYTDDSSNGISFSVQDDAHHFDDRTLVTGFHSLSVKIETLKSRLNMSNEKTTVSKKPFNGKEDNLKKQSGGLFNKRQNKRSKKFNGTNANDLDSKRSKKKHSDSSE